LKSFLNGSIKEIFVSTLSPSHLKNNIMETILCPTDLSAGAANAVLYADELAQRMDSRLVLFHSIIATGAPQLANYGSGPNTRPAKDIAFEKGQVKKLMAIKNTLESSDFGMPVRYDTKIRYGLTKETIPEVVREEHADLVVIGNEGAQGLKEVFIGSVAADLIKNSRCPLLIIPPKATFKPLRKIVFATDLQGEPFLDVHLVIKLAALFEAEIIFVHVITDPTQENESYAEDELARMGKRFPYKNVSFYKERNPHIEEGISRFCRRHHADMLVMGYHPRTVWQDLFTPDYTQEMAYHTYLPILVIHYRQ
jgi:nucleotide-binding universal stress UspA family protein